MSCPALCNSIDRSPPGSSVHGIPQARILESAGKNPGVGCHFLLQGILPTQGSNLCLLRFLHCQVGSLPLVPAGKPNPMYTMHQLCRPCPCLDRKALRKSPGSMVASLSKLRERVKDRPWSRRRIFAHPPPCSLFAHPRLPCSLARGPQRGEHTQGG